MVKEFGFFIKQEPVISKRAENIEIKFENVFYDDNLKSTKYLLSNQRNPEIKFCVHVRERRKFYTFPCFHVEIKRINWYTYIYFYIYLKISMFEINLIN